MKDQSPEWEDTQTQRLHVRSSACTEEDFKEALASKSYGVVISAIYSPLMTPERLEAVLHKGTLWAIKDYAESAAIYFAVIQCDHFKPSHVKYLLSKGDNEYNWVLSLLQDTPQYKEYIDKLHEQILE